MSILFVPLLRWRTSSATQNNIVVVVGVVVVTSGTEHTFP